MKLLIGTNNQNKLEQFERIFKNLGLGMEPISLKAAGITEDVEEDQESLLENAKKKARFFGEKSGVITLADDTGLFIDALGGEPGLHAKRWHEGTEKDRYEKILERMKDVPEAERTCRYIGALAVYNPINKKMWSCESRLEGRIAQEPCEGQGFGYDPIVIINEFNKYYSALTHEERDSISHRGQGVRKLLDGKALEEILN